MPKSNVEKAQRESLNLKDERFEKLKSLFPEVIADGKINWEKLKTILGESIDSSFEKFTFSWAGKSEAIKNVLIPSKATLRPDKKESIKFDESENIFIEGDSLEVPKLLQNSYFEQIKMIYIDPPYNTGNDFVYKDDFKNSLKNYSEQTGQTDSEGNRLQTNTESSGRFHCDWSEAIGTTILGSESEYTGRQKTVIDCVNLIKNETKLTRNTVIEVLKGIKPELIFNNPDRFIVEGVKIIHNLLDREYVSQITYQLSGEAFSVNQFERIVGYKDKIQPLQNKERSIYEAVVWDSENEKNFTLKLDSDERIKLFIKLPHWFKIETPIGGYTPDWAIVTTKPNKKPEKLYFVIETKTTTDESGRRVTKNEKIECAKKHFEIIKVHYKDVGSYQDFEALIT